MKKILIASGLMLLIVLSSVINANINRHEEAAATIKTMTDALFAYIKDKKLINEQEEQVVLQEIKDILLPHVAIRLMSKLILRTYWKNATKTQQDKFAETFSDVLINSYGKSTLLLPDLRIGFLPQSNEEQQKKYVIVRTELYVESEIPIRFDYSLIQRAGKWVIFDVIINGLSMVNHFQKTYETEIQETSFEALLQRLSKSS